MNMDVELNCGCSSSWEEPAPGCDVPYRGHPAYCETHGDVEISDASEWDHAEVVEFAIAKLDATTPEIDALQQILYVEGFGGSEDAINSWQDAVEVANEKLAWLRSGGARIDGR